MNIEINYIASIAIGILLLLVAIAIINAAIKDWLVAYQLRRHGVTTTATVSGLRWEPRGKASIELVEFEFKVGNKGQRVAVEQQITAKHANQLRYGRKVQIRYLPATPNIARLSGADADNAGNNVTTVIAIIVMVLFPPLIVVGLILLIYHGWKISV